MSQAFLRLVYNTDHDCAQQSFTGLNDVYLWHVDAVSDPARAQSHCSEVLQVSAVPQPEGAISRASDVLVNGLTVHDLVHGACSTVKCQTVTHSQNP